jgi:ribosome-associated translation inhibitor RaiA
MRVLCVAKGFTLTDALQECVSNQIGVGLDRFKHLIRAVRVTLRDVNGPKGGKDKRCLVQLDLSGGGLIVRESAGVDAYATIVEAFQRVERAVASLGKRRRRSKNKMISKE